VGDVWMIWRQHATTAFKNILFEPKSIFFPVEVKVSRRQVTHGITDIWMVWRQHATTTFKSILFQSHSIIKLAELTKGRG
jgi:hypothetical protein